MIISISTAFIGSICLAAASIWAGVMDLMTMRIRNEIIIFLCAAYAALAPLAGFSLWTIALSFLVATAVLICTFVFFGAGWIGGGDAKLMAVTALWLGADQLLPYLIGTTIIGGALTLGILAFRQIALPSYLTGIPWVARLHSFKEGVPYGIAIAASALLILPQTPWVTGAV